MYSGREERFVGAIYKRFKTLTGIELNVRYGDSAALAAALLEEGGNSPADVFVSQDAGALGAVATRGRLTVLPRSLLNRVPARFRAPGQAAGSDVSGRARVVVYNTESVRPSELPATIYGYTSPVARKGRAAADERVVPGVRQRDADSCRRERGRGTG